ncbi:translation initiation factor Elf3 subunit 135, putative [Bodo saltans]|uniref:Translation initiation factor Elf3 subunit 135, putative n=1 Tax=Bodo saltans TaxID=75058 RepID=A0A0S4JU47_BODSA|nr:translation initiation factor Elf3 subunit 135, putative [Bodo saltans]|eukprot:CUG93748.1 translation initiation factor Elf3 subunit 135, putative [Bodo saltans]
MQGKNVSASAKKSEKLFDIFEPPSDTAPSVLIDELEFPPKLFAVCSSTSLKAAASEILAPLPDGYHIVKDRGPTAIDAPLARRQPRDLDPVETLRINDHYTPPVEGFPYPVAERTAYLSQWTVKYQKACGAPADKRQGELQQFFLAFSKEVATIAPFLVRKSALPDLSTTDSSPVGSSYSSSAPFVQLGPRCRLGELGPRPVLPDSTISPRDDKILESSPKSVVFIYNGIRYEILNHRNNVSLCGSHEFACKFGAHRFRAASCVTNCGEAFIQQPPMALVEYWGYLVYASGTLPLSTRAPVVYGSRHNGQSESDALARLDDQAVAAMRNIANTINIKGHWCGTGSLHRQFLYSNGDLYILRGIDNRLYIAGGQERLLPPCTTNNRIFPNGYLYRRIRPELLKHSKKSKTSKMPISSDVFSNFGHIRCDEYDREAALLTEVLKQQIITDATNRILGLLAGVPSVTEGFRKIEDMGGLSSLLHRCGVNVRFLGEISTRLSNRYFRLRAQQVSADGPEMMLPISILLTLLRAEMIGRSMKVMIRRLLRNRTVARVANFVSGALRFQAVSSMMTEEEKKEKEKGDTSAEGEKKKRPKATIVNVDADGKVIQAPDEEADEEADTFEAEEDYFNCFERSVWPIIEAKFGSGEGCTIVRFNPNQICVNAQVPYRHTEAVTFLMDYLMRSTGIRFAKKRQRRLLEGEEEEVLTAADVADEIVSGVQRGNEPAEIAMLEPLPVITMQVMPPLRYANGEALHMIGVARSTVRTASLAAELGYLLPTHRRNQLFMSIVDLCTMYCLDSNLLEDQDVKRWMAFRKDAVTKVVFRRDALLKRRELEGTSDGAPMDMEDRTSPTDPSVHPPVEEAEEEAHEKRAEDFFVEEGVIAFPLLSGKAVIKGVVQVTITRELLQSTFGVTHGDILRVKRTSKEGFDVCVVIGMNKYLYVTDLIQQPNSASSAGAVAPVVEGSPSTTDEGESDSLPVQFARALLVESKEALFGPTLDAQFVVAGRKGFLRYYDPTELGIEKKVSKHARKLRAVFSSKDDGFVSSDEEPEERRRLIGTDDRGDACYFFGPGWSVVEYNTSSSVMDSFLVGIRSGHRVILTSTGATYRVIGVREKSLWVCQERVDALPTILKTSDAPFVTLLHLLDRVSYDEQPLRFHGRYFQRSLASLNKFTLFYGQKILLRKGQLAGVVGIVLGTELDVVHLLNITSKTVVAIPGRTREEIFDALEPQLLGCVLDLSVFEPIDLTTYECRTTTMVDISVDIRAERLLRRFGVVQGSLVEILLGPFALQRCRVLGASGGRLWVTLALSGTKPKLGSNALPLKEGEFRVLSDAPIAVRSKPNRRLALTAEDRDRRQEELRLDEPMDAFTFLCATGIPVAFDRHSDVCGVFNLFHGQVVLVAKDVFAKWEPMTVLGVFQGEMWVVPDGNAAAVPLDGFSGTELLQNYSIIEVRGHTTVRPFHDYLHLDGFEIVPFTVHSKVTREAVMIHVLEDTGEIIGLDKNEGPIQHAFTTFPLKFGDRIEREIQDPSTMLLSASASAIWKRRKVFEYLIVMGVHDGIVYGQKEGDSGVTPIPKLDAFTSRVVESQDVIPLSQSTIEHLQRDLRMRKKKSTDADMEHRKVALLDAARLEDPLPFPPTNLPKVEDEELVQKCIPQILDFTFHAFCERFGGQSIPHAQQRLVIHWMLSWFGLTLKFTDTKRDGLLKLCAIESVVLKRPLTFPTLMDYDMFRVRREAERRHAETSWPLPHQQLIELKNEAFTYCIPRVVDSQVVNRKLRLMPTFEEYTQRGEVLPAAALPFSETQRQLASKELLVMEPQPTIDKDVLYKNSRALIDNQRRRKESKVVIEAPPDPTPTRKSKQKREVVQEEPVNVEETLLAEIIQLAWETGLQQLRRWVEQRLAPAEDVAAVTSVRAKPQDASKVYRYKTSEGGSIFLDTTTSVCADVFQMQRGDVFRYSSGDMEGVHVVILGVWEGALWRYEERMSSRDIIMDEQARPFLGKTGDEARPFLGKTGDEIRSYHPLVHVGSKEPRTCDPFYFPRLEGALVKFDIEESSCAPFRVFHGQRFVMKAEPYLVPSLPKCRHGPVVTAIGVYGQNFFFAAVPSPRKS